MLLIPQNKYRKGIEQQLLPPLKSKKMRSSHLISRSWLSCWVNPNKAT